MASGDAVEQDDDAPIELLATGNGNTAVLELLCTAFGDVVEKDDDAAIELLDSLVEDEMSDGKPVDEAIELLATRSEDEMSDGKPVDEVDGIVPLHADGVSMIA